MLCAKAATRPRGVTRGKKLVVLVGESRALHMAVKNNKTRTRHTRLALRLQPLT